MTIQSSSKGFHITLWVLQALLAVMFLMAGFMKLSQPIEELARTLPWVTSVSAGTVRFIGLSELLGALGLLLPALLRIKPGLTIVAALGLATVQILALGFHVSRGEYAMIGMNLLFVAVAVFIAWGRMKKAPIYAR